jgi:hypothetical protein
VPDISLSGTFAAIRVPSELVGYGDSYVDADTIVSQTALERLGDGLGVTYENNGIGGSTAEDVAAEVSSTIGTVDSAAAVYIWNNGNEFSPCLDGSCDYEGIGSSSASSIVSAVNALLAVTDDVTVLGPIDAGLTPGVPSEVSEFMTTVCESYDAELASALSGLQVNYVPILSLSRDIVLALGAGAWADDSHFSGAAHQIVYEHLLALRD